MNRFLLLGACFAVAACGTSDPVPSQADYGQVVQPGSSESVAQHDTASPATAASAQSPSADAKEFDNIEDIEAPQASETPAAMIPRIEREPEVICTKERPTGSIIPVEVCRRRADIEKQGDEDREAFGRIKSNTANAASRL